MYDNDTKQLFLECIRKVYEHCEAHHRTFSRDAYRLIAKELGLEFTSDSVARNMFGSWDLAVQSAIQDLMETPIEVASHIDAQYVQATKKIIRENRLYKVLVIPDIHVPFHNKEALLLLRKFAEAYGPDEVVQLGDLCDFFKISKYLKDPKRGVNIQAELDCAHALLENFKQWGASSHTILEGNHEARLKKYVYSVAPALADLRTLSLENLLGLKEIGWRLIPETRFYAINNVYFTHGEFVGAMGGRHAARYNETIIHGHLHKISCVMTKYLNKTIEEWDMGCLASLKVGQDYVKMANWQLGFGTVEILGNDYWVTPHHIRNNSVSYQGRVLSVE